MLQDVRFAFCQLLKAPGFTIVAIFTLALAICANLVIFSAADAVLLHPLPYPHPERLIVVQEDLPAHSLRQIAPSPEDLRNFAAEPISFPRSPASSITMSRSPATGRPNMQTGHA